MIETNAELVERLWTLPGLEVSEVELKDLPMGQFIRVKTVKNEYLLEVTDPTTSRAHVIRRFPGNHKAQYGYLGKLQISPWLKIRQGVELRSFAQTTPAVKITLFGN